jgi:ABC-type amino acid transport substrate-binding protein
MAEGGAPPPAAMRGGMGAGIVAVIAVVLFVVGFVGGIFAAPAIFPPASPDVLVVGTNTPFAPFEFRDEDGALVGFTIELVEEIATRAGLTVEWRDFNVWESLLLAGQTGAVDMIAASMTITVDRDAVYDFSNSYYSANQAALVPTSSTLTCADKTCTASDLMGLTWVVQTGTTSNNWVRDVLGEDCATGGPLFCFGDVASVINTVRTGGADVAIMDLPAAVTFADEASNQIKAIGKIVTNELYGMAVEEGDPLGILPRIDPVVTELLDEGFIEALALKWGVPTEVP